MNTSERWFRFCRADAIRRLALAVGLLLLIVMLLATGVVVSRLVAGDGVVPAIKSSSVFQFRHLRLPMGFDSWGPMYAAKERLDTQPQSPVYADTLYLDNCKFQYPPSSLLLLEVIAPTPAIRKICSADTEFWSKMEFEPGAWPSKVWIEWASRLSVLGTLLASAWIARQTLVRNAPQPAAGGLPGAPSGSGLATLVALVAALGLTFFPLILGHALGQVQVFLNFFVALVLLFYVCGRPVWAGVFLGLCTLFKPQYGVLLLWFIWRREWRFGCGLLLVAGSGWIAALALYGWPVHLEYINFLRGLARHGESFWHNQSLNGLLSRFFGVGSPFEWADSMFASSAPQTYDPAAQFQWASMGFPPYDPRVYWPTMLSSLLILGLALRPGRLGAGAQHRALDLAAVLAACTIASPIAWHHHYGAFFPICLLVLASLMIHPVPSRMKLLFFALCFLAMTQTVLRPDLMFGNPVTGLLASNLWFGAMGLFGLLLVMRRDVSNRALSDSGARRRG